MTNPEHFEIIKQGVAVWNKWKEENPKVEPDLSKSSITSADLRGINFNHANLSGGFLTGSDLTPFDSVRAFH